MIFHSPLYLILLIPCIFYWFKKNQQKHQSDSGLAPGVIHFSDTSSFQQIQPTWRVRFSALMPWFTFIALTLLIIGLARPQVGLKQTLIRREGIDIILTLDVSPSMLAEDYKLNGKTNNRLEVVKQVAREFIQKRFNDRIGIVVFAGRPYILSPLTWDHDWSISRLDEVQVDMVEEGTAIGSALATAINRLRESQAKSKVVILLTDGVNNAGQIAPETAAEAAKRLSIAVYTIGAGSKGLVPCPVVDQSGNKTYQNVQIDIDRNLLTKIAETTGGRFFEATDSQSLSAIFERINQMEKTAQNMPKYEEYKDLYPYFLGVAFILLLIETLFVNTVFRRLP